MTDREGFRLWTALDGSTRYDHAQASQRLSNNTPPDSMQAGAERAQRAQGPGSHRGRRECSDGSAMDGAAAYGRDGDAMQPVGGRRDEGKSEQVVATDTREGDPQMAQRCDPSGAAPHHVSPGGSLEFDQPVARRSLIATARSARREPQCRHAEEDHGLPEVLAGRTGKVVAQGYPVSPMAEDRTVPAFHRRHGHRPHDSSCSCHSLPRH
jgi:hypothetical protein